MITTIEHLRESFTAGRFELPRALTFHSHFNRETMTCNGQTWYVTAGATCLPLAIRGTACLLAILDQSGHEWYAWFHAESHSTKNLQRFHARTT
jgi:hypothetical protein